MTDNKVVPYNYREDMWSIKNVDSTSLGYDFNFYFDFAPEGWFKTSLKECTVDALNMTAEGPKVSSLHRYNYSLRHFFNFLKEYKYECEDLSSFSNKDVEKFIFYIGNKLDSNSNRALVIAALKWYISIGQLANYEGFPTKLLFDGSEYASVRTEDILKTKTIPDKVMFLIEKALKTEPESIFKYLLQIIIDTGLRLGEAIDIRENYLTPTPLGEDDMTLYVYSSKPDEERYIAVSKRVIESFEGLKALTVEARKALGTDQLAVYKKQHGMYGIMRQDSLRKQLELFVKRHNIVGRDGQLYNLTFHAFRHTLGTVMLNRGMTIFEIQNYLGHLSLHSTVTYAKLHDSTVRDEYEKLGFIGKLVKEVTPSTLPNGKKFDEPTMKSAALPDGACAKPINNEGKMCGRFNQCIMCKKFITTPEHLDVHRSHLKRIRADKMAYMTQEYIGTFHHLELLEVTLEDIIKQLEGMENESATS